MTFSIPQRTQGSVAKKGRQTALEEEWEEETGGRGKSDDPQLVKVSLGSSFLSPPFQLSSLGAFFATFSSPFSLTRWEPRRVEKRVYAREVREDATVSLVVVTPHSGVRRRRRTNGVKAEAKT